MKRFLATGLALFLIQASENFASAHSGAVGIDRNDNGLSDLFELMYQGAAADPEGDPDHDGQSTEAEGASGTNPLDAHSNLNLTEVERVAAEMRLHWSSVAGKEYFIEASPDLSGAWALEGEHLMGDGTGMEAVCPITAQRSFLRLAVRDVDSDGDGASDWEEHVAGTNPLLPDTDGDGFLDGEMLSAALDQPNQVSVFAADALAHESGLTPGSFLIVRRGNLDAITVNFTIAGSAQQGTDYSLNASVSVPFAVGESAKYVTVSPLADALAEVNESVLLTLTGGAGYGLGTIFSATVTIRDSSAGAGGGLAAQYFNQPGTVTSNSTYEDPVNFVQADITVSRIDGPVDFNWGAGTPDPLVTNTNYFLCRWNGYIEPATTEAYTIYFQCDRAAKVWVNNALVIDQWGGAANTEYSALIAGTLQAGTRYPIRIDYRENTSTNTTAFATLRWSSASIAKEVIPANRLVAMAPVISSQPYAAGVAGGPFSYTITATHFPSAYAVDGLPAGLTFSPLTGTITGTVATSGMYFLTLAATNAAGTGQRQIALYIAAPGTGLTRDVWASSNGSWVQDIPVTTAPTLTASIPVFQVPAGAEDQYSERIRGYITAPKSGNYSFFLTTEDENAELWISGDDDHSRKLKRCFVLGAAPMGGWGTAGTQRSLPIRLTAGRKYYVEALRKETTGSDQLAVGWLKPGEGGSVPTEIVPTYALSPYVEEAQVDDNSTLYLSNMTPQPGVATLASGSSSLRLNQLGTEAKILVNFTNLTSPLASWHVHNSNNGAAIFDFDTAVPNDQGVFTWVLGPGHRELIETGNTYINIHSVNHPTGEIKGTYFLSAASRKFTPPLEPPPLPGDPITDAEAIRFLQQATFGVRADDDNNDSNFDEVQKVKTLGYGGWIDEQMNVALSPQTMLQPMATQFYLDFVRDTSTGSNPQNGSDVFRFWWKAACHKPDAANGLYLDQLRQRVTFALSQILVISEEGALDNRATTILKYHDILAANAFGNFRNMLEEMTLSPAMGRYLDMLNNQQPNPNENFAREILQLFSIGLKRTHPDGTVVLGKTGSPVATYDQPEVVGFSHVFTGWQLGTAPDPATLDGKDFYATYLVPMRYVDSRNSKVEKLLLDNAVIPPNSSMQDVNNDAVVDGRDGLEAALDTIFHHPNTGPFICRQLIQRLVTANPSPGYLYRVVRVFENDGAGVRGNMGAVIKALLLDYEARSTVTRAYSRYGHQREPVLRVAAVLRALHGLSMSEGKPLPWYEANPAYDPLNPTLQPKFIPDFTPLNSPGWEMGTTDSGGSSNGALYQTPWKSPTVFNFFEPNYVHAPGYEVQMISGVPTNVLVSGFTGANGLYGPEFQIASETTSIKIANFFYDLARGANAGSGVGSNTNSETFIPGDETTYGALWTKDTNVANPGWMIGTNRFSYSTYNNGTVTILDKPNIETDGADIRLDLVPLRSLTVAALVARLNLLLTANTLATTSTTAITNYLNGLPSTTDADKEYRVWDAIRLVTLSPEFCTQK